MKKAQSLDDMFLEEEEAMMKKAKSDIAREDADPVIQARRKAEYEAREAMPDTPDDDDDEDSEEGEEGEEGEDEDEDESD